MPESKSSPAAEKPMPDPKKKHLIWSSFMTDDYTPIELSWAWEDDTGNPEVRLSIEPIRRILVSGLTTRDEPRMGSNSTMIDGHQSQYFAAFDLFPIGITFKVYYLPAQKSYRDGIPVWNIVHAAVTEMSGHNSSRILALDKLFNFYLACSVKYGLKVEIVGSDYLPASQARVKIYFRTSSSSFQSVRYIMTLRGVLASDNMEAAMKTLRVSWNLVLGLNADSTEGEAVDLPLV
ncbi:tryptophan dimethylallyltransferase-domain-containing protein [Rhexocercosporidium sp. MPI-PUGE-AT-0058]|nr:tryptophan dimethylallyltransferase-domain-containing protein [Rhexocercosporidium sp. MPI-PUGE-AT-0058]